MKAEEQAKYVKDMWITLASVVALLTFIRVVRFLVSLVPSSKVTAADVEKQSLGVAPPNGKIFWGRLPDAFFSAFRAVAFRLNIPIGPGSFATVAELLFILGYIAVMLILLLINSGHGSFIIVCVGLTCVITAEGLTTWFFEDRAAHLASCQLPLIVALAGKNNIIACEYHIVQTGSPS